MKKVHFTAAGTHAEVLALAEDEVRFHDGDAANAPVHVPVGINATPPRGFYRHDRALVTSLSKRLGDFDRAFARRALNIVAADDSSAADEDPEDALIALIDAERSGALAQALQDEREDGIGPALDEDRLDEEMAPDEEPPRESGIIGRDVRPPEIVQKLREGKADATFTRDQDGWTLVLVSRYVDQPDDDDDRRDTMFDLSLYEDEDLESEFRPRPRDRSIARKTRAARDRWDTRGWSHDDGSTAAFAPIAA